MSSPRYTFRNTATAVALIAAALASTSALAEQANIKSMSFDTQSANTTLHVVSSDKQKWDRLKSGTVQFWGHMKVDTRWPGYVQDVGVALGTCGPGQCGPFPPIWSDADILNVTGPACIDLHVAPELDSAALQRVPFLFVARNDMERGVDALRVEGHRLDVGLFGEGRGGG